MRKVLIIAALLFSMHLAAQIESGLQLKNPQKEEVLNEQMELQYFTKPGIISYQNGVWIGNDRLYNLPKNINFIVERIRFPGSKFVVEKDVVVKNVEQILKSAGFNVNYLSGGPTVPLPLFHILITSIPIVDGKVVAIDIRLFENIKLEHDMVPEGLYNQGMTWENEVMVQDSNERITDKVYQTINQMVQGFVSEVKQADLLKKQYE